MGYKLFAAMKAFVTLDGKVLVLRESVNYEDGANTGKFDIVGGRVEPGQHFAESLMREIKEETGLIVQMGKPFYVNEWRPTVRGENWHIIATFFECKADSDSVILSTDHDKYKWIDPESYKEEGLIDNLHDAFETFLNR